MKLAIRPVEMYSAALCGNHESILRHALPSSKKNTPMKTLLRLNHRGLSTLYRAYPMRGKVRYTSELQCLGIHVRGVRMPWARKLVMSQCLVFSHR